MNQTEIIRSFGTEYKQMTKRVISHANIEEEIKNKWESLKGEKSLYEMRIAIKPNLVSPTPASFGATTHPEVVEGIIEYLQEKGFKDITIMEGSWVGDKTAEAFEYCGYEDMARRFGVKLIDTQKDGARKVLCGDMEINICNCTKDVDFMINVPVLKGHCQTKITCALKNMKGLIPNSEKRLFHSLGLHKPIAALNLGVKQDFIVIDHICGDLDFEDGGHPVTRNCVMAAKDPVLVDTYVCKLLGYEVEEVPYICRAASLGIGSLDIDNADIVTLQGEEGTSYETLEKRRRIMDINYDVEEVESCSACYGALMEALDKLESEGLLASLDMKIGIGQGYRGKSGKLGVGNCTRDFEISVPGCPPKAKDIYDVLKKVINENIIKKNF